MPVLKDVPSLKSVSCSPLAVCLASAFTRIDENQEGEEDVEALLDSLPVPVLEAATQETLELFTSQAALFPGLSTALRLLPRLQSKALDSHLVWAMDRHLVRDMNRNLVLDMNCISSLSLGLSRASSLTRLELQSYCTDPLLASIGRNCTLLQVLDISLSNEVTNCGLTCLLSCPSLASLKLSGCARPTPPCVTDLLLGLKYLRKLCYYNMRSVLEVLLVREERGPFLLENFDRSSQARGWLSGPSSLSNLSPTFPHLTSLCLPLSDQEVGQLHSVPNLVHLEVWFSSNPGQGLTSLLSTHPNRTKFLHLELELGHGVIQASHLHSLASNCPSLAFFYLDCFGVEGASSLKPEMRAFPHLKHLNLNIYVCNYEDEEDEDEEEEDGPTSRYNRLTVDFFLQPGRCLEVVNIDMGKHSAFLTPAYLGELVERGVFLVTSHLHLSSFEGDIGLGLGEVHLLLDRLHRLTNLEVARWQLGQGELAALREEARAKNMDITYT